MSGWLLLVPCHGGIGKRIHVTERKTSIERHKLSNYPKPYSKWKRYRPVSSQYLIIDQRIEMRFLNLFNALRPSTSSTLSSGCRPLVKFLKTLFSLKIISWRMKRFASRIGGPISFHFSQFSSTTNNSVGSLSDHRVAPKTLPTHWIPGIIFTQRTSPPNCLVPSSSFHAQVLSAWHGLCW